jgi:hypothetical protein
LSIAPEIGTVTGTSVTIQPATTTEYTLHASNDSGSVTAKTTVTVHSVGESGAVWLPFRTSGDSVVHTRGTNLAVDVQGRIHAAYAIQTGTDGGQRPAYYAYCAKDCAKEEQWTQVSLILDTWVADVRFALNSQGHPRLLLFSHPSNNASLNHYTYATCDAGCTEQAHWSLTPIVTAELTDPTRWEYVFRYFALDPQGYPAFIYTDSSQGVNHNGTFYVRCAADTPGDCTNAALWSEIQLDPHWLGTPSLAFSPSGQPRAMLFYWDNSGDEVVMRLLFLACDAECDNTANWQGIFLADLHGTSRYSLRVNSQGQPRLAFFSGSSPDSNFQPNRLYYLWCNTSCTDSTNHDWQMHDLGLAAYDGKDLDLALDATNHPRIAYHGLTSGLSYAWCNSNCESDTGTWEHQKIEDGSMLENDYPVAPIRHCSISTWVSGQGAMLALDHNGNPRFGYVAEHGYGGDDLDHPGELCPTSTDILLARFAQISQP